MHLEVLLVLIWKTTVLHFHLEIGGHNILWVLIEPKCNCKATLKAELQNVLFLHPHT